MTESELAAEKAAVVSWRIAEENRLKQLEQKIETERKQQDAMLIARHAAVVKAEAELTAAARRYGHLDKREAELVAREKRCAAIEARQRQLREIVGA